jgi:MFS family permease
MLLPVLPFFLVYVLGASFLEVGLIEGLAIFAQAIVQPVSAHFVRTARDRKRGGLAGYSTTTLVHGALALAATWPMVLALRVVAWAGRGFRQPIKRTILSNATLGPAKGATFGLEQALDSIGAVLGTLVAATLVLWEGIGGSSRVIFLLSVLPGLAAVVVFATRVREPPAAPAGSDPLAPNVRARPLPDRFKWFLVAATLFGLGFYNILLAVLDIGEGVQLANPLGGGLDQSRAIVLALVAYLLYNLVYAAASYPMGRLSDRRPGVRLVALAYLLFLPVDALLILETGITGAIALMLGAGLQIALLDVVESAWISRAVPREQTARAFGWFGGLRGLATLGGSVLVGGLWEFVSPSVAFSTSAVFIVVASILLLASVEDHTSVAVRS